jgi:hypothetical protein
MMGRACGTYDRREIHTGLWWGNLKKRDCLEELCVDCKIILKKKWNGRALTGLIRHKTTQKWQVSEFSVMETRVP